MCLLSSCRFLSERQEALSVVNKADSLFAAGELYKDTTKLKYATETLEHSSRYDHNELARAYYYLGRNYDILHLDSKEVPCFFRCIELKPQDKTYIARSYANLMAICKHSEDTDLALLFSSKAVDNYRNSKDTDLYYVSKIHYAELLINTVTKRDEGFLILEDLESQLYNNMHISTELYSVLASAYCNNNEYEKALYTINKVGEDSTAPLTYQCHRLLVLCEIYEHLGNKLGVDSCVNSILKFTDSSIFTSSACNYIKDSLFNNYEVLKQIVDIKNKRIAESSEESKAAESIKSIMLSKKKENIMMIVILIILLSLIALSIITIERKINHTFTITYLRDKLMHQFVQLHTLEKTIRREYNYQRKSFVEKRCGEYRKNNIINWKDYESFKRTINSDFFDLADKLEMNYKLNEKETKLCIMFMIGYDKKYIAEHLFMAENSVGKTKLRIAKKIGITMSTLQDFVVKLAYS